MLGTPRQPARQPRAAQGGGPPPAPPPPPPPPPPLATAGPPTAVTSGVAAAAVTVSRSRGRMALSLRPGRQRFTRSAGRGHDPNLSSPVCVLHPSARFPNR